MNLEQILVYAIAVGAVFGALAGVFAVIVVTFGPVARRAASQAASLLPEKVKSDPKVSEAISDVAKTQAQVAGKQSAEEWFADFGKGEIDRLKERNVNADKERELLTERFEKLEAESARRAAEDQRRISDLEIQAKTLTTQVHALETERTTLMQQRDTALRKAEDLEKELGRLNQESEKSKDKIQRLEIELAGLKAGNAVLQGIFDKIQWLGASSNGLTSPLPPQESLPPHSGEESTNSSALGEKQE